MKKTLLILLLGLSTWVIAQCVNGKAYNVMLNGLLSHSVNEICVDSAAQLMDSAVFVDTRETRETSISTIKNAIAVGYDNFNIDSFPSLDSNQLIIVYCSVGYRSEKVSEQLVKKGYSNVYNLYGGLFEWVNHEHPIYHGDSLTKKIHAYNKVWGKWLKKGEKVY